MLKYFIELMLNDYFSIEILFKEFIKDTKKIINCLGTIYHLPKEIINNFYLLVKSEEVEQIYSENSYKKYERIRQYCTLNDIENDIDEAKDECIQLKGKVIWELKETNILQSPKGSLQSILNELRKIASEGNIKILNLLGFLQMEGIFVDKNKDEGIKNLNKAAQWNSEAAMMKLIHYQKDVNYYEIMCEILQNSHKDEYNLLKDVYHDVFLNVKAKENNLQKYKTLLKGFQIKLFNNYTYDKQFARLLYSDLISQRDIENLLFSSKKEAILNATNLPWKLNQQTQFKIDINELKSMKYCKDEERKRIIQAIHNVDLCTTLNYKPLCIVSNSNYMLENQYEFILENIFKNSHIEKIEVSDLASYDLEPSNSNIFVRSIDEDKQNIYFLYFQGDISSKTLDITKNFLDTNKRSKFRMVMPNIVLNLQSVLPICFCDKNNAHELEKYCNMIYIHEFTNEEKNDLISNVINAKKETYGYESFTFDENCMQKLVNYSVDKIVRIIDDIMKEYRQSCLNMNVDEKLFNMHVLKGTNSNPYGFGEKNYENH